MVKVNNKENPVSFSFCKEVFRIWCSFDGSKNLRIKNTKLIANNFLSAYK